MGKSPIVYLFPKFSFFFILKKTKENERSSIMIGPTKIVTESTQLSFRIPKDTHSLVTVLEVLQTAPGVSRSEKQVNILRPLQAAN